MFTLDIMVWGVIKGAIAGLTTVNGLLTKVLPISIVILYGLKAADEIKDINNGGKKSVSKTKR